MANAISAIVAVAGTILGSALTYFFQNRASARAEASALERELRAERMSVYSSYATALAEFRRGQLDWYNRREEDSDSAATLAARTESYRLKGLAQAALSQVQLVAGDSAVVTAAINAFDLTRPVHKARDGADLDSRAETGKTAVDRFITIAGAEIQSASISGRGNHRLSRADGSVLNAQASAPTQRLSGVHLSIAAQPLASHQA